jgi:hypothetical protein
LDRGYVSIEAKEAAIDTVMHDLDVAAAEAEELANEHAGPANHPIGVPACCPASVVPAWFCLQMRWFGLGIRLAACASHIWG